MHILQSVGCSYLTSRERQQYICDAGLLVARVLLRMEERNKLTSVTEVFQNIIQIFNILV